MSLKSESDSQAQEIFLTFLFEILHFDPEETATNTDPHIFLKTTYLRSNFATIFGLKFHVSLNFESGILYVIYSDAW